MKFQENLLGGILWSHWCNWDNLENVVKVTHVFSQWIVLLYVGLIWRYMLVAPIVPFNQARELEVLGCWTPVIVWLWSLAHM